MRSVESMEIGLMFWAGQSAEIDFAELHSFGLNAGQLGIPGELNLAGLKVLGGSIATIVTAVCSYAGESYADIVTVQRTVGLVPIESRKERIARTKAVSDFAATLSIPGVACHVGFIPHDRNEALYADIVSVVRDICDHCAKWSQTFALETGQEPARMLLRFIEDVARPNLKINFDPANLILYGMGDPLDALDILHPYVVSVHCKDGLPPATSGALGAECRLGDGDVDIPRFLRKLQSVGYKGILSIEREEPDPAIRAADIRHAVELLRQLT